jgi:hypothetical protein
VEDGSFWYVYSSFSLRILASCLRWASVFAINDFIISNISSENSIGGGGAEFWNMHDYRTANMIEVAVHEIMEHGFQDLELAIRCLTIGSMLGYRNQNSYHPPL